MVATAEAPPGEPAPSKQHTISRWRGSPNFFAVAFLVVLPVLVFAVPAMTGHPAISFDNLLQNFPLRVFSGQLWRSGHLPLWNATIWSGSPLLAGLNAGAFYPGTLLFAVFPALFAWVLNLIIVYWAAGLGMYALLRQYSLRPLACLLAAVTYQFGGAMTGQLVHLGIIQGMAWMPLLVLAEIRLSWAVMGTGGSTEYGGPRPASSPWPWVTLLAVVMGLIFLTGEPRSMAEAEIVAPTLLVWLAVRSYPEQRVALGPRIRVAAYGVAAAAWGLAIGASQLLPGRSFIVASQRATEDYTFFGLGSLRPAWSILLLVQNVLGGNQIFNQPPFAAGYNLPEVTGYVGLLPLVAFLVLLARSIGRRSDPRARDWRPWLCVAVLGLLLSFGTYTPLGHVFAQIPFYNKVRLDSRSLGIVDLGLAVLFGFWLELFFAGEWRERVARPVRWLREVVAPLAPPVAGLAAAVVACAIPATVLVALGAAQINPSGHRAWMAAQAVVAGAAVLVVWAWRHWSPASARRLVVAVVAADLGLFALTCSTGMFAGGKPQPSRAAGTAVYGTNGRFAIVGAPNIALLSTISEPDLNALTSLDSVQGYGSILSGPYDQTTGTHLLSTMDPCALAKGVFVPLRLSTLLVSPNTLSTSLAPGATPAPLTPCPGAKAPGTPTSRTLYFGRLLDVASAHLVGRPAGGPITVALLTDSGAARLPREEVVATTRGGWDVRFSHPALVAGLVVVGPARGLRDISTVTTTTGARYALNGPFQNALGQTSWHFTGFWSYYAHFATADLGPKVAVRGAPGATVRRLSITDTGTETDLVDTPASATVVRSEAYLAGWSVRAQPVGGGPTQTLPVFGVGLLQGVRVPPGRWKLTFSYWPSGLTLGGVASALGVGAVVGVTGTRLWGRRRRQARPTVVR